MRLQAIVHAAIGNTAIGIAAIGIAVLVVTAGCSSGGSAPRTPSTEAPSTAATGARSTVTTTGPTTTGPTTTGPTTIGPTTTAAAPASSSARSDAEQVAGVYVTAMIDGDLDAWRAALADDARFRSGAEFIPIWEPLSEYEGVISPDFDGDGIRSIGDQMLVDVATGAAHHARLESLHCDVAGSRADCAVTATDAFYTVAAIAPQRHRLILTVEDGRVTEVFTPQPAATAEDELAALAWNAAFFEYETWVFTSHGTRYRTLFGRTGPTYTLATIPEHAALVAEWRRTRLDPRTAPATEEAIVFQRRGALGTSLWRIDAAGTGMLPLPVGVGVSHPAWSPDRSRLAFDRSEAHGARGVWVAAADGSAPTRIAAGDDPAWTPDGERVVFAAVGEAGSADLFEVERDGGDPRILRFSADVAEERPRIAPGGRQVMFGAVSGTDEPACHVLDLTTGSIEQVTAPGARHCAWSPDGIRIAFDVFDGAGGADVWVIGAGGDAVRLTTAAGIDMAPAFSPDGTRIVFSSDRANEGGALDLWIMDADGTDPRQLTATETFDVFADWG